MENAKDEMKRWFQSEEEQLLQIEELLDQSQSEREDAAAETTAQSHRWAI